MNKLKKYLLIIQNKSVWESWKKLLKQDKLNIEQGLNKLIDDEVNRRKKNAKNNNNKDK